MTRKRTTWATSGRKASPPPATPGYAEYWGDDPHPAAYQDPGANDYQNGDTSSWAEDVVPGPFSTLPYPSMPHDTEEHPATKRAADMKRYALQKAEKCIKIATSMLGKRASARGIEDQAFALMSLPDREIEATLKRLGGEFMAEGQNDPFNNLANDDFDEDDVTAFDEFDEFDEVDEFDEFDDGAADYDDGPLWEDDGLDAEPDFDAVDEFDDEDDFGTEIYADDDFDADDDGGIEAEWDSAVMGQRYATLINNLQAKVASLERQVQVVGRQARSARPAKRTANRGLTANQMLAIMLRQAGEEVEEEEEDEDEKEASKKASRRRRRAADDKDEDDKPAFLKKDEDEDEEGDKKASRRHYAGEEVEEDDEDEKEASKKASRRRASDDEDEDDKTSSDDDDADDEEGDSDPEEKEAKKAYSRFAGDDEEEDDDEETDKAACGDEEFFAEESDLMGLDDEVDAMGMDDDSLMEEIYGMSHAASSKKASKVDALREARKAGLKSEGLKPQPRKKSAGVQTLGNVPKADADADSLSSLWSSKPDISKNFGY